MGANFDRYKLWQWLCLKSTRNSQINDEAINLGVVNTLGQEMIPTLYSCTLHCILSSTRWPSCSGQKRPEQQLIQRIPSCLDKKKEGNPRREKSTVAKSGGYRGRGAIKGQECCGMPATIFVPVHFQAPPSTIYFRNSNFCLPSESPQHLSPC